MKTVSRFSLYYSFLIPLPSRRHKTVLFFMQMIDRTIITTLTAEDLRDLVAEAVEHALQSFPKRFDRTQVLALAIESL